MKLRSGLGQDLYAAAIRFAFRLRTTFIERHRPTTPEYNHDEFDGILQRGPACGKVKVRETLVTKSPAVGRCRVEVDVCGFIGEPQSPRLVVALRNTSDSRPAGMTVPLGPDDAARIAVVAPLAVAADRPLWAPFDSGRADRWFRIPPGLVAEVAYSHLDGDCFRHTVRFLRWRIADPSTRMVPTNEVERLSQSS